MKKRYVIIIITIIFVMFPALTGCNQNTSRADEFYNKVRRIDRADRFDYTIRSEEIDHFENELLLLAKKNIYSSDYEDQDTAICIVFSIVEPDQVEPPKCYLISDLKERFLQLYKINKEDNEVGIASEKFLYNCFNIDTSKM